MSPEIPDSPPPPRLVQQRCYHHGDREAAARCPGCGRYYCRACVSPFDHRLLCASCIRAATEAVATPGRPRGPWAAMALQALAAGLLLWTVFYVTGSILLHIPNALQVMEDDYEYDYVEGEAITYEGATE